MTAFRNSFVILLAILAPSATAQPNPDNVRDGCATGVLETADPTNLDLFVVPAGATFILTDFSTRTSCVSAPLILDDNGTVRWNQPILNCSSAPCNGSIDQSWKTGLRFTAGQTVRVHLDRRAFYPDGYSICFSGYLSTGATSAVPENRSDRLGFRLGPNPTRAGATIWFRLDRPGPASVAIYDIAGRRIRTLQSGRMTAGDHSLGWDGRTDNGDEAAPGMYMARLATDVSRKSARLVRVR